MLTSPVSLTAFCDVDWASNIDGKRSTSGAAIILGPNLISWRSRKQQVIAWSKCLAKFGKISAELTWIAKLLTELNVFFFKTP